MVVLNYTTIYNMIWSRAAAYNDGGGGDVSFSLFYMIMMWCGRSWGFLVSNMYILCYGCCYESEGMG